MLQFIVKITRKPEPETNVVSAQDPLTAAFIAGLEAQQYDDKGEYEDVDGDDLAVTVTLYVSPEAQRDREHDTEHGGACWCHPDSDPEPPEGSWTP